MADISVSIIKMDGRKIYYARWIDPTTNRRKTKSTGTTIKRDAERFAGILEKELQAGTFRDCARITWQDFRERYESEVLPGKAEKTRDKIAATFNTVERIINPGKLVALTAAQIGRLVEQLREELKSEATIKGILAHLKSALRWGHRRGMLPSVPSIEMPKRTAGMKGRPISGEEFDRMLAAIPETLFPIPKPPKPRKGKQPKPEQQQTPKPPRELTAEEQQHRREIVSGWEFLLRGLWWSGLRLGEALALSWTDDREIMADLSGEFPMFIIQARAQKSHKAQVLPMAPEFARLLAEIPEAERVGYVFNPRPSRRTRRERLRLDNVSTTICKIGENARVKVSESTAGKVKHASAHDLRRAFGFRWSQIIMPADLQQLMRHEDIKTTMEFYVGRNAQSAAKNIWKAAGAIPPARPADPVESPADELS